MVPVLQHDPALLLRARIAVTRLGVPACVGIARGTKQHAMNETPQNSAFVAPRTYRAKEVARLFGMTPRWVYRQVEAGQLPVIRFGRTVLFPRAAIDALVVAAGSAEALKGERS